MVHLPPLPLARGIARKVCKRWACTDVTGNTRPVIHSTEWIHGVRGAREQGTQGPYFVNPGYPSTRQLIQIIMENIDQMASDHHPQRPRPGENIRITKTIIQIELVCYMVGSPWWARGEPHLVPCIIALTSKGCLCLHLWFPVRLACGYLCSSWAHCGDEMEEQYR